MGNRQLKQPGNLKRPTFDGGALDFAFYRSRLAVPGDEIRVHLRCLLMWEASGSLCRVVSL